VRLIMIIWDICKIYADLWRGLRNEMHQKQHINYIQLCHWDIKNNYNRMNNLWFLIQQELQTSAQFMLAINHSRNATTSNQSLLFIQTIPTNTTTRNQSLLLIQTIPTNNIVWTKEKFKWLCNIIQGGYRRGTYPVTQSVGTLLVLLGAPSMLSAKNWVPWYHI
jgi:hypothetical protein